MGGFIYGKVRKAAFSKDNGGQAKNHCAFFYLLLTLHVVAILKVDFKEKNFKKTFSSATFRSTELQRNVLSYLFINFIYSSSQTNWKTKCKLHCTYIKCSSPYLIINANRETKMVLIICLHQTIETKNKTLVENLLSN